MKNVLFILCFILAAFQINAQGNGCNLPTASFSPMNEPWPSLEVPFTNSSTSDNGTGTSLWDFGDGTTSTIDNPVHTYLYPGDYIITLTYTDDCGSSSAQGQLTVSGNGSGCNMPMADFYPGDTTYEGLEVFFSNVSTSDTGGALLWDFGDGSTSADEFPMHTYTAEGTYTVCLTITDDCGTDTTCKTLTVTGGGCEAPVVDFYPGNTTYEGLEVFFSNVSTSTGTTGYSWDFGDGNTSADPMPVHTYAIEGTYIICLEVTDECGADTLCKTLTVTGSGCEMPVADFYPGNTTYEGLEVFFSNVSTSNGTTGYSWDFGDGNTSTDPMPVHTYTTEGTYIICLEVGDECGTDTICKPLTVTCPLPLGSFSYVQNNPDTPGINFTNTSTNWLSIFWDFGDGQSASGENPFHLYPSAGLYDACVIVDNDCGIDTFCMTINVTETCTSVPPASYGTTAISTSSTQVYWEEVPQATFYQVKYRRLGTSDWLTRGTSSTQRNLPGLDANKYYQYKIRSQCADGSWSDFTDIGIFYSSTCNAPSGVASIYLDQTRVRIRWDVDAMVEKNRVKYREIGTSTWLVKGNTPGNNYIYINGLTPNTTYEYRVRAKCSDNDWSAYSDLLTFSTDLPSNRMIAGDIKPSLSIFPNPVMETLNIQYESAVKSTVLVKISDITGRMLHSQKLNMGEGRNIQEINVSQLEKGYYIISIQEGSNVTSMQFIKK